MNMAYVYLNDLLGLSQNQSFYPLQKWTQSLHAPTYFYDWSSIQKRVCHYQQAFNQKTSLHFAMKANSNPIILQSLAGLNIGVDVVSGGELEWAIKNRVKPDFIVFSGVAKSQSEIEKALNFGIKQINVESLPELQRVSEIAKSQKKIGRVALRVNPNLSASTHHYITTGLSKNKFGLPINQIPMALEVIKNNPHLHLTGLAAHIGSQILEVTSILEMVKKLFDMSQELIHLGWNLKTLDMGGGVGIQYDSDDENPELERLTELGQGVQKILNGSKLELLCEPGRFLVARAGVLLTQVEYLKRTSDQQFLILSSGMNHLMRPALYGAHHRILPLNRRSGVMEKWSVVGPICESADVLAENQWFGPLEAGDWLAIMDVGAYGMTMASDYNLRPLPEEIVFDSNSSRE